MLFIRGWNPKLNCPTDTYTDPGSVLVAITGFTLCFCHLVANLFHYMDGKIHIFKAECKHSNNEFVY